MSQEIVISRVSFAIAPNGVLQTGLFGWVSLVLNGTLRLDGVALRRTADGRLTLSFPARRDGQGRAHPYIRPIDDRARREIEAQVFAALGLDKVPR